MRLVDADTVVTIQVYDDMTENTDTKKMTIAEAIDEWSDEGCPPTVDIDEITESHERTGYDRGFRDGYAQATSEVRRGHWIERIKVYPDLLVTYNYQCSNCGYWDMHGSNVEVPYCWHCGAKMDEVEK